MKTWIQNYIDKSLAKKFNWFSLVFYFSLSGVFMYYVTHEDFFLNYESALIPRIVGLFVIGLKNGIIIYLSMSLLISITGKLFFDTTFRFKETMKAFYISFKPHIVTFLLFVLDVILAHLGDSNPNFEKLIFVQTIKILIDLSVAVIGIITLVILIQCLMRTQNLTLGKTILNYLAAGILNAPLYIFIIGI